MIPPGGAVFVSYASQDAVAARRIVDALRAAGVEVWFDQNELGGGDAWDRKIRGQIGACALFVPVVSAATQARREGYFRLEWKLADERTHLMAEGTPFILPVVIDETKDREALVPKSFLAVQWTRAAGGEVTGAFGGRVRSLLGGEAEVARAFQPASAENTDTGWKARGTTKTGRRVPVAVWGVAILVLAGVGVGWWQHGKPAPTSVPNAGAGTRPPTTEKVAAPAISPKSIAVLPFENRSDDKENAFFTDGVHGDILTNLTRIRELHVTSRTSVMEYRGTTKKMPQIGRELGVAWLLEGSVQRSGRKVRVTGQLINARTDEHLWAESYDRDLTAVDIFVIQSELAQKIAASLQMALSPIEKQMLARRPTENLQAYDLFLKAREIENEIFRGAARVLQGNSLEEAVRLDPKFAEAWADLSSFNSQLYRFGERSPARLARAKDALATAERLAPELPEVVRARGDYYYRGLWDLGRATESYETLIRLLPNDAAAYHEIGVVQRRQGRWPEALKNLRRAVELDPRSKKNLENLEATLEDRRMFSEAREVQGRLVAISSQRGMVAYRLALISFLERGSTSEVGKFFRDLTDAEAKSTDGVDCRTEWATSWGDVADIRRFGSALKLDAKSNPII